MKSQNRAWIILAVLLVFWNELPVSPFRYFADMLRQWFGLVVIQPFLPPAWQAMLLFLLFGLLLAALLLLGRSGTRLYLAGLAALATMIHHMIYCIRTGQIYAVSPAIAIGLALALLFIIIKAKSPALWLSDFYTISLAVWLLHDSVLTPWLAMLGLEDSGLASFLDLPAEPLVSRMDGFLGLPAAAWAIWPAMMAILPLVFFARGRQKG